MSQITLKDPSKPAAFYVLVMYMANESKEFGCFIFPLFMEMTLTWKLVENARDLTTIFFKNFIKK